ncbi:GATA zinc finger protein [Melia azedarach]|uniref:GATA zinc finger protein n=1 Tax=Melia azedarach TaxID=155640 RepID=A0ACC1X2Y5_MELAZ|nr:GATA zinc finger protein [Melia azedarach]
MAEPEEVHVSATSEPRARPVGGTEYSWCRAVPTGTGITVLSLLLSKLPDVQLLQTALNNLQNSHPILRSKLRFDSSTNSFSFVTPPEPHIQITSFDLSLTSQIIRNKEDAVVTPFHLLLEHEMNQNTWSNLSHQQNTESNLFYLSIYTLSEAQWAVILRLHTSICDRAAAVGLLRELLELMVEKGGGIEREYERIYEVNLGIEDYIPSGKANKPFWARGVDMLGYSLNSFRLANISFLDADSPRYSQVVRLQLNGDETAKLLASCKSRGIKLCGALAAAGLIAARSSKDLPDDQREKYAVVTLIDCRSILEPPLSSSHLGFYHSAILNTHDVSGDEKLWELATRSYTAFTNSKNYNKHFTDMSDLNFLMCKAIENPGLTPSSSLRTAFISVFEDPVIDESNELLQEIGLEDYVGCASVHGVGPSIAIFDTVRNGQLDCACVYPSPIHSREQMQKLVDEMKRILVGGVETEDEDTD